MPFIIAFAITLHVAVLAPLFIVASQGDQQLDLNPLLLLRWPLAVAVVSGFVLGAILKIAEGRGWSRAVAVAAAIGIALYAQFYVLVWDFGPFDGRAIVFDQFILQGAAEIAMWVILLAVALTKPTFASALFGRLVGVLAVLCVASAAWLPRPSFATPSRSPGSMPCRPTRTSSSSCSTPCRRISSSRRSTMSPACAPSSPGSSCSPTQPDISPIPA
jgi:hypothetical protein